MPSPFMISLSCWLKSGLSSMAILTESFPFRNPFWAQMASDMAATLSMDCINLIKLIERFLVLISLQMALLKFHLEVLIPAKFLGGLKVYSFWQWILNKTGRYKYLGFRLESLGNLKMEVIAHSHLIVQKESWIRLIRLFYCRKWKANLCSINFCMESIITNSLAC